MLNVQWSHYLLGEVTGLLASFVSLSSPIIIYSCIHVGKYLSLSLMGCFHVLSVTCFLQNLWIWDVWTATLTAVLLQHEAEGQSYMN